MEKIDTNPCHPEAYVWQIMILKGELPMVLKREFIGIVLDLADIVVNKTNKTFCLAGVALGAKLKT